MNKYKLKGLVSMVDPYTVKVTSYAPETKKNGWHSLSICLHHEIDDLKFMFLKARECDFVEVRFQSPFLRHTFIEKLNDEESFIDREKWPIELLSVDLDR